MVHCWAALAGACRRRRRRRPTRLEAGRPTTEPPVDINFLRRWWYVYTSAVDAVAGLFGAGSGTLPPQRILPQRKLEK